MSESKTNTERLQAQTRYTSLFKNFKEEIFKSINDKILRIANIVHERESYPDMYMCMILLEDLNDSPLNVNEIFTSEPVKLYIINEFLPNLAKNLILNRTYSLPEAQKVSDHILWECLKFMNNNFHLENPKLAEMTSYIFDADRNYYSLNNIDGDGTKMFGENIRLSEEHKQWLKKLKENDIIDAVKQEREHSSTKQIWSRAKISILVIDRLKITFLDDSDEYERYLGLDSLDIAPLESHSLDWDWRLSLKIGDELDACDNSNNWYTSTIIDMRTQTYEYAKKTIREVLVAYRVYRENGDRKDYEDKSFFGWSSSYDTWMNIHSPKLLKLNQIAKYQSYSLKNANHDEVFDDYSDLIYEENNVQPHYKLYNFENKFVILRSRVCKSYLLINWINHLGAQGFFDKLLNRIEDKENWIPIDFLSKLILAIGNISKLFYRNFAHIYLKRLVNSIKINILESPESNFRNFTKERIDDLLKGLEKLIKRVYNVKESYEIIEQFTLKIALICFKSNILERKIQGLKMIQDIIKNIKYKDFKILTYSDLALWIDENKIFEDLFSPNSHSQLIQRSSECLRFLLIDDFIKNSHLQIIWSAILQGDVQSKHVIYKIISDLSTNFSPQAADFIITRISEISKEHINKEDLDLLYELSRFPNKGSDSDFVMKSVNVFWGVITESKNKISKEIYDVALEKLSELVTSYYLRENRIQIMEMCIESIEKNIGVVAALKIYNKIFNNFPEKIIGYSSSYQPIRQEVCRTLEEKYDQIKIIIENLVKFKKNLVERINKNEGKHIINESFLDKLMKDHSNYIDQISERVLIIQNIAKFKDNKSINDLLGMIWDVTVENSLISPEKNVIFRWIKEISEDDKSLDFQEIQLFLNEKLLNNDKLVEDISMDGFLSFKSVFLAINKHKKKLEIIYNQKEEIISINFNNKYNEDDKPTPPQIAQIITLCDPEKLEGISFLWGCCLDNIYDDVSNKSIEFLTELYMNSHDNSIVFQKNLRNIFLEKCFNQLEKDNKSLRTLVALNSFLDESEKYGIGNLKSHNSNIKGEIFNLSVYNDNVVVGSNYPKNIDIKINTTKTLFDLRIEIAKQLTTSWDNFRIFRSTLIKELKDKENGYNLAELRLRNGEKLSVRRRNTSSPSEAELVNSEGVMNPRFLSILKEWFSKYSTSDLMSPDHYMSFLNSVSSKSNQTDSTNDRKIKEIFAKWDFDKDGFLNLEEFVNFYHFNAQNKYKMVWAHLSAHNIRNDLRKETDVESHEVIIETLPRYLISQNNRYYTILFKLLEKKGNIAEEVWKLLNRIPTSTEIFSKVTSFNQVKTNWQELLDYNNNYQLLYCLNIIEYMLEEEIDEEINEINNNEDSNKNKFRTDFILYGGFEHLFNLFKIFNSTQRIVMSFLDKNILIFSLKIIKNYIIAALGPKINDIYKLTQLIKLYYLNLDVISELKTNKVKEFDDKKLEAARKRLEEPQEHKKLVVKLSGELGQIVLETLDLSIFSNELLILGQDLLIKGDEDLESEEKSIIELVLTVLFAIWLYKKDALISNKKVLDFFLEGIFTKKSQIIRKTFKLVFYLLIIEEKESFSHLFINIMLENLPDSESQTRKDCAQFYELLCKTIEDCIIQLKENTNVDFEILISQMINKIKNHNSSESQTKPIIDNILIGYLNLLERTLDLFKENSEKHQDLANYLFENCLFTEKTSNISLKCRTSVSRKVVYKIISNLTKENLSLYSNIFTLKLIPLIKSIPRTDKTWNFNPILSGRSITNYAGLKNLGCICYMNAMLQQFFMHEPFRYALLRANDHEIEKLKPVYNTNEQDDDNVLHQLQKMFVFLEKTDRQDYNPISFCSSFRDYTGNSANLMIQQDAQEFLNMIFDKLENGLKKTPFCNILENVYGGKYCNQMICKECNNVTNRFETFYNLSLQVKNMKTLYESLEKYIAGETISDFYCDKCLKKTDITKRCVLSSLPNILIVHLQRLVFNLDTLMNEKINSKLEFPQELNLMEFMKEEIEKKEMNKSEKMVESEKNLDKKSKIEDKQPDLVKKSSILSNQEDKEKVINTVHPKNYYEYKLKGVVIHMGVAEAGHYYSFINIDDKKWLEFNDSNIREFDAKLLEQECFGGSHNDYEDSLGWEVKENAKSAYILVYERKMKEDFELKISSKEEKEQIVNTLNLVESEDEIDYPRNYKVNYYDMNQFIPSNFSEIVMQDNLNFMFERNIYSDEFFKFIVDFFSNIITPYHYKDTIPDYSDVYEQIKEEKKQLIYQSLCYGYDFLIEIAFRANDKGYLKELTSIVRILVLLNPDKMEEFFDKCVLTKQKEIFEMILSCSEQSVRSNIYQLILQILTVSINHYNIFENTKENFSIKIINFINNLIALLPVEAAKNWTKFQQYFEFFKDFAGKGPKFTQYLREKELVSVLIDFFLESKSPISSSTDQKRQKMGNNYSQPPFEPLFQCLQILCTGIAISDLSKKDKICLTCKEFYEKALSEKYNYIFIGNIVEIVAFENPLFSADISMIILQGVNKTNYEDVEPYIYLMGRLLILNDSLQRQRIEWILGYPQPIYNRYENYGLFDGIDEQIWSYESTLLFTDENISFLNYIFSNKDRFETHCLVCTDKLITIALHNEIILNYLISIPPPIHRYSSYLNWIKPQFQKFHEDSKKYNYSKNGFDREERSKLAIEHISKLEEQLKNIEIVLSEESCPTISYKSDYELIILGKTVKETQLSEDLLYKHKGDAIKMIVNELLINFIESKPNLYTNEALPKESITEKNGFSSRAVHPDCNFFLIVNSYYWDDYTRKQLIKDDEDNDEWQNISSSEIQKKNKGNLTIHVPGTNATHNSPDHNEKHEKNELSDKKSSKKNSNLIKTNLNIKESNLIRRYIIVNETYESIKVHIKFLGEENVFTPLSISKRVKMKSSLNLVTLMKKKYDLDWPDKIEHEITVEMFDQNVNIEIGSKPSIVQATSYEEIVEAIPCGPYQTGRKKTCINCYTENDESLFCCSFCQTPLD